jgi:hypothetical protein
MAYHAALSKLNRALVAYIVSLEAGSASDTWPAKRAKDKTLPCTICYSHTAAPIANTGNWTAQVEIQCRSKAFGDDDTDQRAAASDARTAKVFDCFFTNLDTEPDAKFDSKKVAQQVEDAAHEAAQEEGSPNTDLAEFAAHDVRVKGFEDTQDEDGDAWIETLKLEIDFCPSAVE